MITALAAVATITVSACSSSSGGGTNEITIEATVVAMPISAIATTVARPPGIRLSPMPSGPAESLIAAPKRNTNGIIEETIIISISTL